MLIALINAPQETPPILDSNAQGVAFLTIDIATRELCYSISYSALLGTETVAHFHGPAAPGQSAGAIFDISPNPSPLGSPKSGCVGPLSLTQLGELTSGLWYINIHSDVHGGGEIRGQVVPVLNVP